MHVDGGLRPRFIVPARKLHHSGKLALEQLALVETLSIGCHAVDRAGLRAGEQALVIGAGPIGLSVIEFAKIAGARVAVMDVNPDRLEFCKRALGIERAILSRGDGSESKALEEITAGDLAGAVFDATGSARSMSDAFNHVAHTGRLVFVGITTEEVRFRHPLLHRREMTVLASRNSLPRDFERIIGLIEAGRIDTRPWITHRIPFAEMIARFPSLIRPETGAIKAVVDLDGIDGSP